MVGSLAAESIGRCVGHSLLGSRRPTGVGPRYLPTDRLDCLSGLDGSDRRSGRHLASLGLGRRRVAVRAAADARDDVLVEPAKHGRHEASQVGDG